MRWYILKAGKNPHPNKEKWEDNWELLQKCYSPSHAHGKVDWKDSPQFCGYFLSKKAYRSEAEARTANEALSKHWFNPDQVVNFIITDAVVVDLRKDLGLTFSRLKSIDTVAQPRVSAVVTAQAVAKSPVVRAPAEVLKADPDCGTCEGKGHTMPHPPPAAPIPCGCLSTNR